MASTISILFLLLTIVTISIVCFSLHFGISPMPSNRKVKRALLTYLPDDQKGKIYELGSGWGGVAFLLARRYPNCQIVAFEGSWVPYFCAKLLHRFYCFPNLTFRRKNFFDHSLDDATGVFCYLYPGAMEKLKVKFEEELHPGTWVLSNTFAIPGWSPEKAVELKDIYRSKLYHYFLATAAIASPAKNQPITMSKSSTKTKPNENPHQFQ